MNQPAKCCFCFGEHSLNVAERLLWRKDQPITLAPKVFDTLVVLVENAGHLVEKGEFMKRLWPDTFVGEDALARNISILRKALGGTSDSQTLIVTVPTRGYRFEAAVHEISETNPEIAAINQAHIPQSEVPTPPRTSAADNGSLRAPNASTNPSLLRSRRFPAAYVVLAILLGVTAGFLTFWLLAPARLPDIKFRQITANSADDPLLTGSLSPDGKWVAYVDQQGMHTRNVQSGATVSVQAPDALQEDSVTWDIPDAAWLPDGTAFIANAHPAVEDRSVWSPSTADIWMFSLSGALPRRLRKAAMAWAVLPDGSISFSTGNEQESWLMDPDGSSAHKLFDADTNSQVIGPFAQSSLDRHIVLYLEHNASGNSVLARDLRQGPPVRILGVNETSHISGDFVWLPDGRLIYQASDSIFAFEAGRGACRFWVLGLDLHTGKPHGPPQPLADWQGYCPIGSNATADGKHLAFLENPVMA